MMQQGAFRCRRGADYRCYACWLGAMVGGKGYYVEQTIIGKGEQP